MISEILNRAIRFVPALFATVIAFSSVFSASLETLEADKAEQVSRIASLEQAYMSGEIAPVDENGIYDGDLAEALESGIKFNELSFLGTHNSYQKVIIEETKKLYESLSALTFGLYSAENLDFESETLTDQLNCGIRSFEIDIETFDRDGEISFTCMHNPYFEMSTSCYDFSLAMKEISMWSDNNPGHLPITLLVEPKSIFIPLEDMEFFNIEYAEALDDTLRETLGDKLFTPADMQRDYASFGEMRAADGWCEVKDMLGKVVVLLHDCSATEKYIAIDPAVKTQAMFPVLREGDVDRDCASVILCNKPEKLLKIKEDIINNRKIMVRTRADQFNRISEDARKNAFASGANIISTDYPVRTDTGYGDYVVTFGGKTTVRPNK